MRIISDFHDFYDCIQRTGQDQTLVYLRKPRIITTEDYGGFNWWVGPRGYAFSKFKIGFCGKIYRGIRVAINEFSINSKILFCYSEDSIYKFLSENLNDKKLAKYTEGEKRWSGSHQKDTISYFEKNPTNIQSDNDLIHHFSYESPLFTQERICNESVLTLNGQLKKFEFFRVLDPFQAFQELSSYLGSLAVPLREPPTLDDKIKAELHGFDKYSFRKDKS